MASARSSVGEAIQSEQVSLRGAEMAKDPRLDNISNLHEVYCDDVLTSTPQEQSNINKSQIFIRACNRTIILNVDLQRDSVEEIQRMIEEREGIPANEQHLTTVGGKPLRQGTFLRDYDALGCQSTIHVSPRIPGGHRSREMVLEDFVRTVTPGLTGDASIPNQQPAVTVKVLNPLGRRILHGVLSCVLSAHTAGLAYGGHCGMDDLRVFFHETEHAYVSRVGVGWARPLLPLDGARQREDYLALLDVLEKLFPLDTMHVGSTIMLLESIAGYRRKGGAIIIRTRPPPPQVASDDPGNMWKRTQLLRAHAAIASSPLGVATTFINLKRFYNQLPVPAENDENKQRFTFRQAMEMAQQKTYPLEKAIEEQPLFQQVDGHEQDYRSTTDDNGQTLHRVPNNQYSEENYGLELLFFARNWFTHVPAQRRGEFDGLPHLDHIFTYHFENFLPEALLQLYTQFDDPNLLTDLTQVLVPLG